MALRLQRLFAVHLLNLFQLVLGHSNEESLHVFVMCYGCLGRREAGNEVHTSRCGGGGGGTVSGSLSPGCTRHLL